MNIFALHTEPVVAAHYHSDKHVVKIILETTQILMTNFHHVFGGFERKKDFNENYLLDSIFNNFPRRHENGDPNPYGMTHFNHPSTIWARQSSANWKWTLHLGIMLCFEYQARYKKRHVCHDILKWIADQELTFESNELTPFALAISDKSLHDPNHVNMLLKAVDSEITDNQWVNSYRAYYIFGKYNINKWNHSDKPLWYPEIQLIKNTINETIQYNKELQISN